MLFKFKSVQVDGSWTSHYLTPLRCIYWVRQTTPHHVTQCWWIYWVRERDCVWSKRKGLLLDCSVGTKEIRSKWLLPEINTVRADMTRTSLVCGIFPFCCKCTNNIWLVCGKCKLEVTSTSPAKRPHHLPGFQQCTTVLCITAARETSWVLGWAIITASTASCNYVPIATRPLPGGCHEVQCLGANRRKVIALLFLCGQ